MKKLELKHLAPYLPYGLFVMYRGREIVMDTKNIGIVLKECSIILRPLSDLTKEIECNDIQFIPSKTLMRLSRNDNFEYSLTFAFIRMLKLDIEQGNERDLINDLNNAPYWVIQKLFEWHFNVFNLPEHLYIDKSTIK